ncbi:MAG: HEAT repeat domain-containing protein [Methanospirillum sp.]|nr:HEAT repeat domain-containing protein [Methanospirillum sp.]
MEKKQAVNDLVTRLVEGTTYQMLEAAQAAGEHGGDAVGPIAALISSADRETRWRAAVALERIGAPAVEALVSAAASEDYLVRVPAIWALEHIGDPRGMDVLYTNLEGENETCRWMAAAALSRIGGDQGRTAVDRAFADDPTGRGIVEELIEGS